MPVRATDTCCAAGCRARERGLGATLAPLPWLASSSHAQPTARTACAARPAPAADLKTKAKRALKAVIQKTTYLAALEPLLKEAPVNVLKHVLIQFKNCLPNDVQARRNFVQSGGLQIVQQLNEAVGGQLSEIIEEINKCYPPEIVQYYSPGYSKTLMQRIDEFQPSV